MATTAQTDKPGTKEIPTLRFPASYNPTSPEVIERRRKLFEDIARNRTPESDVAMAKIAKMFAEDDDVT